MINIFLGLSVVRSSQGVVVIYGLWFAFYWLTTFTMEIVHFVRAPKPATKTIEMPGDKGDSPNKLNTAKVNSDQSIAPSPLPSPRSSIDQSIHSTKFSVDQSAGAANPNGRRHADSNASTVQP
jgi:hypothetical protein